MAKTKEIAKAYNVELQGTLEGSPYKHKQGGYVDAAMRTEDKTLISQIAKICEAHKLNLPVYCPIHNPMRVLVAAQGKNARLLQTMAAGTRFRASGTITVSLTDAIDDLNVMSLDLTLLVTLEAETIGVFDS
jgi:hypothetical protein